MSDDVQIELRVGDAMMELTERQYTVINPQGAQTIGELHDQLSPDFWTYLPEYGLRVRLWGDEEGA